MLEWLKNELRVKEECAAWNEKNGISHEWGFAE
jgi:hypothetical protein